MNATRPGPIGNRRVFWSCVAVGWILIVAGVRGVIVDARFTRPPQWSAWFVGAALFHDLLVAPVVFAVSRGMLRRVRPPYRAPVQAGLALTALVAVATIPVVFRPGKPSGNPTVLPHDAAPALIAVLGAIWAVVALVLVRAWRVRGGATASPARAPRRPP